MGENDLRKNLPRSHSAAARKTAFRKFSKTRKDFIDTLFSFSDSAAAKTTGKPVRLSNPSLKTRSPKQHPKMKSSNLLKTSTGLAATSPIRIGFAALFAGALALGLGASSVMAQGPYYPVISPVNVLPISSSPEFNFIESKMVGGATLFTPPPAGKHTASALEYNAAVTSAATAVANGSGGAVTIATLSAEVAKYRSDVNQVAAALGALANGIIASGSGTKQAQLGQLAFNAAKANPAGFALTNTILSPVFQAAAADNTLFSGVNQLVGQALAGSVSGLPPSSALTPTSVFNLASNAATAVVNSLAPAAAVPGARLTSLTAVVDSVSTSPVVNSSLANLDAATNALSGGTNTSVMNLPTMLARIKLDALAVTENQKGAIAQGALRGHHTAADFGAIASGIGAAAGSYTYDLIYSYQALQAGTPADTQAGSVTPGNAAAVAAASGTLKSAAGVTSDVVLILNAPSGPFSSAVANAIVSRAVGANQNAAVGITAAVITNYPALSRGEVTFDAAREGRIADVGLVARAAVTTLPGPLTTVEAGLVAKNAVDAAIAAAASTNPTDAFSDISYQLGNALKLKPGHSQAAVTEAVKEVSIVDPSKRTYIPVIAQLAGDNKSNYAAILAAGIAADATGGGTPVQISARAAAINSGATTFNGFTSNPLNNYKWTLGNIVVGNSDAQNLSVGYAAALGNSGDAAGALAALIGITNVPVDQLTTAAINANRAKQVVIVAAADAAAHFKATPNDIQAYLGARILDNPTAIKELTTAATVIAPQFSHVIAHTLAFNAPKVAYGSVADIYLHSQITFLTNNNAGPGNNVDDRPAAAAAITAGLTTGLIENTQLSVADRHNAIRDVVGAAVTALVSYGAVYDDLVNPNFRRSTGVGLGSTTGFAKGVAGGITGFVAQMVKPGDASIGGVNSDIYTALFQAAYNAKFLTGSLYILDIAQAAGQAFGWVSGQTTGTVGATTAAAQIAQAIDSAGSGVGAANILAAVNFGIDEAKGGDTPLVGLPNPARLPGAGAFGLRNGSDPAYTHHSAQGTPVSNIFSL